MKIRHALVSGAALAVAVSLSGCSLILTATEGTHEQERSAASKIQVQADVLNAKLAITGALVSTGSIPATTAELSAYGFTPSSGVTNWVITGSGSTFCVSASSDGGDTFHATESSQPEMGPC